MLSIAGAWTGQTGAWVRHCWGVVRRRRLEVVVTDLIPVVGPLEKDKASPFSKSSQFVLLQVQRKDEVFSY